MPTQEWLAQYESVKEKTPAKMYAQSLPDYKLS